MKQEYLTFLPLLLALAVVEVNAIDSIQQLANATVATSILANQQSSVTPGTPAFSNSIVLTRTGSGSGDGEAADGEGRNASEKQEQPAAGGWRSGEEEEEEEKGRREREDASQASGEQSASRVAVRASLVPSSNGTSRDKSAIAANTIDSTTDSTSIASSKSLSHLVSTSVSTDIRTTTANAWPAQVRKVLSGTSITSIITTTSSTTALPLLLPSTSFDAGNFTTDTGSSDGMSSSSSIPSISNITGITTAFTITNSSSSKSQTQTRSSSNVSSIHGEEDEIGNPAGVAVDTTSKFNRQYQPHKPRKCSNLRGQLANGRIRMKNRDTSAQFSCFSGFTLIGARSAYCRLDGTWNIQLPVCAGRGCSKIRSIKNGVVTEIARGLAVSFRCNPGYALEGPSRVYCDGVSWNASNTQCKASSRGPIGCDFEDGTLCGWSEDPDHDTDWIVHRHSTPTEGTGPLYDHTFGREGNGYYLYVESSSPSRPGDSARLFSPVINGDSKEGCLRFWYHMWGSSVGSLAVFIKGESQILTEVKATWIKEGAQADEWMQAEIPVANLRSEPFQLILTAKVGSGHTSDIAVDDLDWKLGDINCNSTSSPTFSFFSSNDSSSSFSWSSSNSSSPSSLDTFWTEREKSNTTNGHIIDEEDFNSSGDIDNGTITRSKYNGSLPGSNDETREQVTRSSLDLSPSDTTTINSNESTWQSGEVESVAASAHVHPTEQVTSVASSSPAPLSPSSSSPSQFGKNDNSTVTSRPAKATSPGNPATLSPPGSTKEVGQDTSLGNNDSTEVTGQGGRRGEESTTKSSSLGKSDVDVLRIHKSSEDGSGSSKSSILQDTSSTLKLQVLARSTTMTASNASRASTSKQMVTSNSSNRTTSSNFNLRGLTAATSTSPSPVSSASGLTGVVLGRRPSFHPSSQVFHDFYPVTVNRADQKSNGLDTRELDAVKKPLKNSLSDESVHSTGYNSDLKMELGSERAKNIDGNHATSPVKSDLSEQSKTSNINTGPIREEEEEEKVKNPLASVERVKEQEADAQSISKSSISGFNKWPSSDEFSSLQVKNIPSQGFKLTFPVFLVTCVVISIALIALALARNMGSTVLLMSSWSFGSLGSCPGSTCSFTSHPASHSRVLLLPSSPSMSSSLSSLSSSSTFHPQASGAGSSWWRRIGHSVTGRIVRLSDEQSTCIELASSHQFTNSLCNKDLSSEEEREERARREDAAVASTSLGGVGEEGKEERRVQL